MSTASTSISENLFFHDLLARKGAAHFFETFANLAGLNATFLLESVESFAEPRLGKHHLAGSSASSQRRSAGVVDYTWVSDWNA